MRYLSAGESHGPRLTAIIEGMPANLTIDIEQVNYQLARRQKGYGRGGRMEIETDQVIISAGVRHGLTTGAPICLEIENKDWKNWQVIMAANKLNKNELNNIGSREDDSGNNQMRIVTKPRPGHADLTGGIKYQQQDLRNVLERASARETAIRVAVGAIARQLLESFGIKLYSHVLQIGSVIDREPIKPWQATSIEQWLTNVECSGVRSYKQEITKQMIAEIDKIKSNGDSIGGIVETIVTNLPPGLGSYVQWDRKIDALIASAVMSVQAIKAVEIGIGTEAAMYPGSQVHDEIFWNEQHNYYRKTNNAGGIEGGMTNGEPLVVKATMKPIPTLYKPLQSVDISTKEAYAASIERSDVCAVPAAAVVVESAIAWTLATVFLDKFSGDSIQEVNKQFNDYLTLVNTWSN